MLSPTNQSCSFPYSYHGVCHQILTSLCHFVPLISLSPARLISPFSVRLPARAYLFLILPLPTLLFLPLHQPPLLLPHPLRMRRAASSAAITSPCVTDGGGCVDSVIPWRCVDSRYARAQGPQRACVCRSKVLTTMTMCEARRRW